MRNQASGSAQGACCPRAKANLLVSSRPCNSVQEYGVAASNTHTRTHTHTRPAQQAARASAILSLAQPPRPETETSDGGKEVNLPKSARTHGFGMGLAALWLARLRPDGWGSFFHAWLNRAFVPRARVRLDLASFRWVPLARLAMGTRDFFGWERGGEGENGGL